MHFRVFFLLLLVSLENVLAVQFPYPEWNLATYHGAYAIFGEGFVSVTDGGSDYWHVQLTRGGIELRAGKTYEVRFFLQGVSARRYVEVRIGRDGFPYDAFAEFGEVAATANGKTVARTFTMRSGSVSNARFEFNLGKATGTVYVADISLDCLDCGDDTGAGDFSPVFGDASDYVVVADTVDFRDGSMSLGSVFGTRLELGADSKVFGDVDVVAECFLRERASIGGGLRYGRSCVEQNGVSAKTKSVAKLSKPAFGVPNVVPGISPVSVGLEESAVLPPGSYGTFYAAAKSRIRFSSGAYAFQYFYTEPDAEITFDLSAGPVTVGVSGSVRFGDRNRFSVIGGNPSEILWNVSGERVDMGTDGLYFGKFVAPKADVRIPSRSHLVGGVYAGKFAIEPQSTVSREPRAREISHGEEHFGPFFEPGRFRYRSRVSPSVSRIEMFVYADSLRVAVNGGSSRVVDLSSPEVSVDVSLSRNPVAGFPSEAFRSGYRFDFLKDASYRIYWNPQTPCRQGCDGMTAATAIGDFAKALETARTTGREINMSGGTWNALESFPDGVVPWKVGFELVGNTESLGDLSSEDDLPLIDLGNAAHVEMEGRSPRSLTGFRIANGYNAGDGGAIRSANLLKLKLSGISLQNNFSKANGGAISFLGDSLVASQVYMYNNRANGLGGGLFSQGKSVLQNIFFIQNTSKEMGSALYARNSCLIQNVVISQNMTNQFSSIVQDSIGNIDIWNATIFKNVGNHNGPEILGKGTIWNSIIWKNLNGSVQDSLSAKLSVSYSLSSKLKGPSNYATDPNFINESFPDGSNRYIGVDAGLIIDASSPIVNKGDKEHSLPTDILGIERGESFPFGAYGIYVTNVPVQYGLWYDGEFHNIGNTRPVFENFPSQAHIEFAGHSAYGRVMKALVKKHEKTKISKAIVRISLMDSTGTIYPEAEPIEIPFYRHGEENGKYAFMSLIKNSTEEDFDVEKHGHYVLFSRRAEDQGFYDEFVVIHVKNNSDRLKYEVVKW